MPLSKELNTIALGDCPCNRCIGSVAEMVMVAFSIIFINAFIITVFNVLFWAILIVTSDFFFIVSDNVAAPALHLFSLASCRPGL